MPQQLGPAPGALCGLLTLVVLSAVSVALLATTILHGSDPARRLQMEDGNNAYAWLRALNGGTGLAVILLGQCIGLPLAALYWRCFILPTHDKFIPQDAIVPQELFGMWKYGQWEVFGACGTCLCFCFCPCCSISEYWYRAGHLHASSRHGPEHVPGCPGWQFFLGCCGFCMLQEMLSCCYVVGLAAGTGGLGFCSEDSDGGSGMGSIVPFRQRYGIPHYGWKTFIRDCCCWLWCMSCQATREYRQVSDTLAHWPLQTSTSAPGAMVVGQPVAVGQPVEGGAPAKYSNVPKAF